MKKLCLSLIALLLAALGTMQAQQNARPRYLYLYQRDGQIQKISLAQADSILFTEEGDARQMELYRADGNVHRLSLGGVDSLRLSDDKLFKGNYLLERYSVPRMSIEVEGGEEIDSKEKEDYKNCRVEIEGGDDFAHYSGTARMRGRGNSSWLYYPKRPYRLKLDKKAEILGLGSDRDWVLLSNYRDPTQLMNAYGFELARYMGLHYFNHNRYVELTLNGEYIGLYQLTEQVEQGGDRVDIDEATGLLLEIDMDDGPGLNPGADDNFYSQLYGLPMCLKFPEEQTPEQLDSIKADFARVEEAIRARDYDRLAACLDVESFISYLMIEELVHNVEMQAPRSIYLYKDADDIYHFGPVWDFDGAFAYSWAGENGEHWLASHGYFVDQNTIYGDDPATSSSVNRFFLNMFRNPRFVAEYKARWSEKCDGFLGEVWSVMDSIVAHSQEALARNLERWPTIPNYTTEVQRLKEYLTRRVDKLTRVIAAYPDPTDDDSPLQPQGDTPHNVTQSFRVSFPFSHGSYSGITVRADLQSLCNAFQMDSETLLSSVGGSLRFCALNRDDSHIYNSTANGYGHWFNAQGDVCSWGDWGSTLYSEFSEQAFTFTIGQYPGRMQQGERYTIRQALVAYDEGGQELRAEFVFNVTLGEEEWSRTVEEEQR